MQWLTYGIKNMIDGTRLVDYGIVDNSTIFLNIRPKMFRIHIRNAVGDKITLTVNAGSTIKDFKKEIELLHGIPQ